MSRLFIIIILISFNLKAQENHVLDLEEIKAFAKKDSLRKDSIKTSVLNTKWTNSIFMPFKEQEVQFPFKLEFNDVFYASPVSKNNVITSRYGWRWGRQHKGIDIDLISGDKVMAMLDGKVRYVGYHSGHGKVVIIRHFNGLETVYAHLSKYNVKENETVTKGQVIGEGGRTGNARGSHVHLETIYKGNYINPEYLFSFDEDQKIKRLTFWITKEWATPYLHNSKKPSDFVYYDTLEEAINHKDIDQKIYVVKPGDTLYDISKKYKIPISSLCHANSISTESTLRIGQELVLGL
jgi:murein DD-endopeptidase MepM/ murein hydrolase activator NlpD